MHLEYGGRFISICKFNDPHSSRRVSSTLQRVAPPWGALEYVGNWGGPGEIRTFSGTILSPYWGDSTNAPSTGAIGMQSITDGSSNTALFSERLMGLNGAPASLPGQHE
jgi:hypothetical protein